MPSVGTVAIASRGSVVGASGGTLKPPISRPSQSFWHD
jgi:hypothetical protein